MDILNEVYKYSIDVLYNFFSYKHHGNHVFGDFIWDVKNDDISHEQLAETIFNIMEEAILQTSMTIVHKKLCILGQTDKSPPGFTSCILIDESHCTSHCYSDRGWLAIDVFTCSSTDPGPIMDFIKDQIMESCPSLKCTFKRNYKRFHYL